MQKLIIEMTDAELYALDIIAADKQVWADNFLTNRAREAKEELKLTPEWATATSELAKSGGNVSDDWAVLLKGKELKLFKTAAQKQAEAEASAKVSAPGNLEAPGNEAIVRAHALKLKIDLVNTTRTDGGKPYPVSPASLTAIRENYVDILNDFSARKLLGETITADEQAIIQRIRTGFAAFKKIDRVMDAIIAADDVADPVSSDKRWP